MSMFTKRHYKAVAQVLRVQNTRLMRFTPVNDDERAEASGSVHTLQEISSELADVFYLDNPKFNHQQFLAACQPKPNHE